MNRLTPLTEIDDLGSVARDLNSLLQRDDNADVAKEFPETVSRYGGILADAKTHLEKAREKYEVGARQQFIVFAGEHAVGMSLISNILDLPPEGVDPNVPNISGFVANPFRGEGLGRLSIEERMKVVKNNFNNRAWTFVNDGNLPSKHLVMSVGFQQSDREIKGWEGHHLYLFGDAEQ